MRYNSFSLYHSVYLCCNTNDCLWCKHFKLLKGNKILRITLSVVVNFKYAFLSAQYISFNFAFHRSSNTFASEIMETILRQWLINRFGRRWVNSQTCVDIGQLGLHGIPELFLFLSISFAKIFKVAVHYFKTLRVPWTAPAKTMTVVLFLGVQFISLFLAANAFFNSSQVGVAVTCSVASGSTDMEHCRTSHDWRCRSWVPLSTSAAKFISRSLSVFFNSFVMWCYRNGFSSITLWSTSMADCWTS